MVDRYRFIETEKATYPVAFLCKVLGVSRSGFYAWRQRPPSHRSQVDCALTACIVAIHRESHRTYGVPRVHAELQEQGNRVGRNRVWRLMRAAKLAGRVRGRRSVTTTISDPSASPAPNIVEQQFDQPGPDRLWVGDITYVPTKEGWLYLAVLLDAWSRRVIGWAMADHLRTELPLAALQMALAGRRPAPGQLVHHTDRGGQYTSEAYGAVLRSRAITPSMSRRGNCYDNALAESFFGSFKAEAMPLDGWASRTEAERAIFSWLEVFYNRRRRHSSLGYRSPVDYETQQRSNQAA